MGYVSINKGNASNIINCETAIVFGDVKGNIANADIVVVYGDIKGNMLNVDTVQYRTRDKITDIQVDKIKKHINN